MKRAAVAAVAVCVLAAGVAVPVALLSPLFSGGTSSASAACQSPPAGDPAAPAGAADVGAVVLAIRTHESGGDYTAKNAGSTASGGYQFEDPTWRSESAAAGFPGYPRAMDAPPEVQDAVAVFYATNLWNGPAHGDPLAVAGAWYLGHVPTAGEMDVAPPGNNGLTPRMYEAQIAALMANPGAVGVPAGQEAADPAPPSGAECVAADGTVALAGVDQGDLSAMWAFAAAQLGKPYLWGGTGPDAWDCSGLVQAAYAAAGVQLPRVAAAQYEATAASTVPYAEAEPGDLLFWSYDGNGGDAHHVAIYLGGGLMLDAPHTGAVVRVEQVWQTSDFLGLATRPTTGG